MQSTEQSAPVKVGDVLAGKFRVERVLGVGGMGIVVAAHHLQLDERVALKFLLPHGAGDAQVVARFMREARAAAKIKSEHVARVIDVGTLDGGAPFMVMEFLEGSDLAGVLEQRGPLPVAEVVGWILQACEALAEAHVLGIVHRDLKPPNLFLARRPGRPAIVQVLDFGISKAPTAEGARTRTSAIMGSPLYMSPEQLASSRDVDPRADVWALGGVLHQHVAGAPPFDGATMPEVVARILQSPPIALATRRPDAPPGFAAVIARCLEKDPARRFENVAELARALEPFGDPNVTRVSLERIESLLGDSRPVLPSASTAVTAPTAPHAWGGTRAETRSSRRPVLLLVAGALVAVAVVGVGVAAVLRREPAPVTVPVGEATPVARVTAKASAEESSLPAAAPTALGTTIATATAAPTTTTTTTTTTATANANANATGASAGVGKASGATGKPSPGVAKGKPAVSTSAAPVVVAAPPVTAAPPPKPAENPIGMDWKP
ncbi:MAG: hypothetical protein NVSMB47_13400 [Polyangiales bacterium]